MPDVYYTKPAQLTGIGPQVLTAPVPPTQPEADASQALGVVEPPGEGDKGQQEAQQNASRPAKRTRR